MTARPPPIPAPMKPSPRLLLAASAATWSKEYMVMELSKPLKIELLIAPRR